MTVPAFLVRLMSAPKLNMRWKIDPEQRICCEFADMLRACVLDGQYAGVWSHAANEGKRHPIVACILKRMGMIPGTPDYFFMWGDTGRGVIEVKTPKGRLTESQIDWRSWCEMNHVPHAKVESADEGIATLKTWGALS